MSKWINGVIFPIRPIGKYPQIYIERCYVGKFKGISISMFEERLKSGIAIKLPTRAAKLLVKRMNLCLMDNTRPN